MVVAMSPMRGRRQLAGARQREARLFVVVGPQVGRRQAPATGVLGPADHGVAGVELLLLPRRAWPPGGRARPPRGCCGTPRRCPSRRPTRGRRRRRGTSTFSGTFASSHGGPPWRNDFEVGELGGHGASWTCCGQPNPMSPTRSILQSDVRGDGCYGASATKLGCSTEVDGRSQGETRHVPLLDVADVSVRFGGIVALDDLSFSIDEGQICGLIGPERRGQDHAVQRGEPHLPADDRVDHLRRSRACSTCPPTASPSVGVARTFQNLALFPTHDACSRT